MVEVSALKGLREMYEKDKCLTYGNIKVGTLAYFKLITAER